MGMGLEERGDFANVEILCNKHIAIQPNNVFTLLARVFNNDWFSVAKCVAAVYDVVYVLSGDDALGRVERRPRHGGVLV